MEPSPPSEDESPYDAGGGFAPYQPGPTPEELREGAVPDDERELTPPGPAPYVPYGDARPASAVGAYAVVPATDPGRRTGRVALLVGVAVGVLGIVIGIVVATVDDVGDTFDDLPVISDSNDLPTNDLIDGQCLIGDGLEPGDEPVDNLEDVPCDEPHDGQVLGVNVLDEDEAARYNIDDDSQVTGTCDPHLTNAERRLIENDRYYVIALTEKAEPVPGDHVACIVVLANGDDLTEPLGRE